MEKTTEGIPGKKVRVVSIQLELDEHVAALLDDFVKDAGAASIEMLFASFIKQGIGSAVKQVVEKRVGVILE